MSRVDNKTNSSKIKNKDKKISFKNRKFRGDKLESALTYRGMTLAELADRIGVSKQSVSQYKLNQSSPSFEVLLKMINVLEFPLEYFYEKNKFELNVGNTYFRASSKMQKKEEYMQSEKTKMIGIIHSFLNEYIEFPTLNLPQIDDQLSIEEKAMELRRYWELGDEPISDMIYVLEKNGIIVSSMNTETDSIDAYNQKQVIDGAVQYIVVLGNDKKSLTRRQFSAAHELAHIILHDGFLELKDMTTEELRKIENEAHEFASAFLLPKSEFSKDVNLYPTSLEYYVELKKKWKASISAMIVRANRLDILSYSSYQSLMKKMSKLGWRKEEPLDNSLIMNNPTIFSKAIDILLDNEILNEEEIIEELSESKISLNWQEVEILLGLEKNKLKPRREEAKVIEMKIR